MVLQQEGLRLDKKQDFFTMGLGWTWVGIGGVEVRGGPWNLPTPPPMFPHIPLPSHMVSSVQHLLTQSELGTRV